MPDERERQIEAAKALLEDGREAEHHTIATQIVTFRERALRTRAWAWVFLAAIVLSLGGGLGLYVFAPDISKFDTARQLDPKKQDIAQQRQKEIQKLEQIRSDLAQLMTPFGGAFSWKQIRQPGLEKLRGS